MQSSPPHILLMEDEQPAARMMAGYLEKHGYRVAVTHTGHEALRALEQEAFALAVLDIMVPGPSGLEVLEAIRASGAHENMPVLFLTARSGEEQEIAALGLGADDYLVKPTSLKRLQARIAARLRRKATPKPTEPLPAGAPNNLRFGPLQLVPAEHRAYLGGQPLELTAAEYQLLELLLQHPKKIFSRAEILEALSSAEHQVFERTVDAHVKNLRLKLGYAAQLIKTHRGLGYALQHLPSEEG